MHVSPFLNVSLGAYRPTCTWVLYVVCLHVRTRHARRPIL